MNNSLSRERSDSPRAKSCDNVASESISLIAAAAPAIDTTLLLKVPPWVSNATTCRVKRCHHIGAPTECSKRHSSGQIFSQRGEIRKHPGSLLETSAAHSRCHDLIEDQQRTHFIATSAQCGQVLLLGWDAATGSHHWFDEHRGNAVIDGGERVDVVIAHSREIKRRE